MKKFANRNEFQGIQQHILDSFGKKNRFAVIGGPGTGKTVLALEGLNKILENDDGDKVCLLVFNRALQSFLEKYVKYSGDNKIVSTWHSFIASYMMQTMAIDFHTFLKRYEIQKYSYDFVKMLKDLETTNNPYKYNYIFVDEAQDFPDDLLVFLDSITLKFYVFFDDNQKFTPELLDQDYAFSAIEHSNILNILNLEEDFYDLTINFRNTQAIEQVAKLFDFNYMINNITLRRTTVSKEGQTVELIACSKRDNMVRHIIADYQQFPSKTIGVLLPKFKAQKDLLDTYKALFEQSDLLNRQNFYVHTSKDKRPLNENGVFLMTYQIAKGLEFDKVYLIELNHEDFVYDYYHKNAFYVSITRAKEKLSLVFDSHKQDSKVVEKVQMHQNLFNNITLEEVQDD